jgi:hypothetical protein
MEGAVVSCRSIEVRRSSFGWVPFALVLVACAAGSVEGQSAPLRSADRSDLAALVLTRDAAAGGHRARLATHAMQPVEGKTSARVSAALFLPDGERTARNGLIAFLVDEGQRPVRGGTIRFGWHFAGMDTVVAFPARVQSGSGAVSYGAELTEQDLRFLATAHRLEVALPDGSVLIVDADLRRRLGLFAGLSTLSAAQRDELAAFSRAIDGSIRSSSRR